MERLCKSGPTVADYRQFITVRPSTIAYQLFAQAIRGH